jgi:nucleotidyltransferase substrate binding protein (TIGR01987 family)
MPNQKVADSLESLGRALERLREGLELPEAAPLAIDGTIQRFEFVIELFWKVLKRALAAEGIETATPREALQRAYQAGWLADETTWLSALRDRNATSHLYDEAAARAIYSRIRTYWPEFKRCHAMLVDRFRGD